MGLLKSRKDAAKEFERYVDAVEHPPELDDYVEEDELGDQDTILPGAVSVEEIEAQLAARRAMLQAQEEVPPEAPARISAAPEERKRLGEVLVDRQLLTGAQLDEALAAQAGSGKRLGEYLVDAGILDERDLASALADQFGLEVVDLRRSVPSDDAVAALEDEQARDWLAIPLRRTEFGYDVAVADPSEPGLADKLRDQLHQPAKLYVAGVSDVRRAIDVAYKATSRVGEHVRLFEARAEARRAEHIDEAVGQQVDENAPVVQVVNLLLSQAVTERASDVHIEPMDDRLRIRNRVDGALHEVLSLPAGMGPALVSRIKVMANMNIVERRRPQDGQLEATVDGVPLDVRVSTTSTVQGEKCVLRILDKRRALFELSDLGMPPDMLGTYESLVRSPYGMVICAGPTGSGKTTTLYATLTKINSTEINVMTVEDPVEYVFPSVNQIQINEQAGVTFAGGLRSILRQDPDAILVGEIRDVETARMAVQSALTGHLVLSSLHATDAVSALHRFLDMGIESFLIASSMLGVVGQRLVRRICPECKVPYQPSPEELAVWEKTGMSPKETFFHGEGCVFCSQTGYQGRIGVYEVLRVTDEMKALIVANANHDQLKDMAVEQGMIPLQDQALRLVEKDVTTVAEIMRTIYVL
ncbi:MAG: GspE/PulE family protein [Acidimicrobiia bacterium]